jgi:sugar phosphate isomerase/epimerase
MSHHDPDLPSGLTVIDGGVVADDDWEAALKLALADIRARLDAGAAGTRTPLFEVDAAELLDEPLEAARWLVEGLVTRGGITVIGAEPKAAKTWLATEFAIAVATGTKMCGAFSTGIGRAVYFFAEDMKAQIRNRVRALCAGAGRRLDRDRLRIEPRGSYIDILDDRELAWIVASCRRFGVLDLLVLDPLRDIHSGEEDKSDSMREVMRRLRVLAELLGCTVAVVHHAPKASKDTTKRRPGQNLRGSGAIHGSIDSGLYLENTDGDGTNLFTNTVTSQVKGARSAGRFKLELRVEDDDQGEAVRAAWMVSRDVAGKGSAKHQEDDDKVCAFVRELATRGVQLSKTALRDHDECPVPEKRARAALDRLLESGRLLNHRGRIVVPGSEGSADA